MKMKIGVSALLICVGILTVFLLQGKKSAVSTVYENLEKSQQVQRKDLEGNYFIVHFWAKWCEPCADEIPHLVEFAKTAQFSKPLKILAISLDPTLEESKSILPNQGKDLPANFVLISDPEHKVAEAMGSFQYPETYFVGPNGEIQEKWIGPQKWGKPEVLEFFKLRMK